MESLVYENSPLADYLEGMSPTTQVSHATPSPVPIPGEGESNESWLVEETRSEHDPNDTASNFAPRGASKFQERVRNKLPKPLDLSRSREGVVIGKLYNACSVWFLVATPLDNFD
jgi:hypothetical protein